MRNNLLATQQPIVIDSVALAHKLNMQHPHLLIKIKSIITRHKLPYAIHNKSYRGQNFQVYQLPLWTALSVIMDCTQRKSYKLTLLKHITDTLKDTHKLIQALCEFDVDIEEPDVYLYLAQEQYSKRYKLGISQNPERRIKQLQTGNPEPLVLLGYFKTQGGEYTDERHLHHAYKAFRLSGEWFMKSANIPQELQNKEVEWNRYQK